MSLQQLPVEVLTLIAKNLRNSDIAYKNRTSEKKGGGMKKLVEWRGKSRIAFASVNKQLREIVMPYLRTNILVRESRTEVFQYVILGSPLANSITTLSFSSAFSNSNDTTFFLINIASHLPNVQAITNLGSAYVHPILTSGETDNRKQTALERGKLRRSRAALLALAARVSRWQGELYTSDWSLLLSASGDKARSLDINTFGTSSDVLADPETGLIDVLSSCRQLETLVIRSHWDSTTGSHTFVNLQVPTTSIPFANSLRFLALDFHLSSDHVALHLLHFANSFPNLASLSLSTDALPPDEPEVLTLRLPRLKQLSIGTSSIVTDQSTLYPLLHAPELSSLHLEDVQHLGKEDESADAFQKNVTPLLSSLRAIKIQSRSVPEKVVARIRSLGLDFRSINRATASSTLLKKLHDVDSWQRPKRPRRSGHFTTSEDEESETEEQEQASRRALADRINAGDSIAIEAAEELVGWAGERMKHLRAINDVDGAKELVRTLRETAELRRWLKD